jgi:hypothetical protein
VDNRQLFKFDSHVYSVPRPYAGKEIGIIAYSFRVELYYRGNKIWECGRPIFEYENRVYAEHFLFDLEIKPRSRENALPLLEGVLPPELHMFRKLCKSKTTKCYQLYTLMRMMEEVGPEKLLKAVGAANDAGSPTLQKVEQILSLELKPTTNSTGEDQLGQSLVDDEFYVQRRDPSDYDVFWGRSR